MKAAITIFLHVFFITCQGQMLEYKEYHPIDFDSSYYNIVNLGNKLCAYPFEGDDGLNYFITSAASFWIDSTSLSPGAIFIGGLDDKGELAFTKNLTEEILLFLPDSLKKDFMFSNGVSAAGDLNNDGIEDLIYASSRFLNSEQYQESLNFVYLNKDLSVDSIKTVFDFELGLKGNQNRMGYDISNLGDWDNNGYDDLAISLLGYDVANMEGIYNGAILVMLLGENASIINTVVIENTFIAINDYSWGFGKATLGTEDMNNDGIKDLIVGVPHGKKNGSVQILYLNESMEVMYSGEVESSSTLSNYFNNDDHFGEAITSVGDLNNDSIPELLISVHWSKKKLYHEGEIIIVSMDKNGLLRDAAPVFDTTNEDVDLKTHDHLGRSLITIGDINNDGIKDILVAIDEDNVDAEGKLRLISTDYSYLIGTSTTISDLNISSSPISLAPNPCISDIKILNNVFINDRFKIINMNGQALITGNIEAEGIIDVTSLKSGYHFLVIKDKKDIEHTAQFIKI